MLNTFFFFFFFVFYRVGVPDRCTRSPFPDRLGSVLRGSIWSRMSRQLSQLLTPDLPAGATTQFGGCPQPSGSLPGGHLSTMAGLKSLLQHPAKGDPRGKSTPDVKGEVFLFL